MMTGSKSNATLLLTNLLSMAKLRQRTMVLICVAVFALFLLALLYSIFQWQQDWRLAHKELANDSPAIVLNEPNDFIAKLPEAHLFGQAVNKVGEVPTSTLQLLVTGIVKSDADAEQSKAYISIAGQPSKIYRTGDDLPYGVKVYSILKDAVIVENNGRLEKILLPREPLHFKSRVKDGYHA